ncbi:MAG: glycosyltransferase family 2 protein [Cyanobacteria bacterium J06639_16]
MQNESEPLVSVLMNCYNGETYLREAIDCVLAQTYQNWELIFWDNQSTDRSAEIFKSYGDARLKYFRAPEHTELGAARARAFQHLSGEFVAVLDADDLWLPHKLEKQIPHFGGSGTGNSTIVIVGTWCRCIDETGQEINQATPPTTMTDICDAMVWGNPLPNSSIVFRKAAASRQGGYDASFVCANDFDLWLKLIELGDVVILPEFLTDIRDLSTSLTRSSRYRLHIAYEDLILHQRAAKQLPLNLQTWYANRKALARHGTDYGQALLQTGMFFQGWKWIIWGLWKDPLVFSRARLRSLKQLLKENFLQTGASKQY